jgi:hypothetical protein
MLSIKFDEKQVGLQFRATLSQTNRVAQEVKNLNNRHAYDIYVEWACINGTTFFVEDRNIGRHS